MKTLGLTLATLGLVLGGAAHGAPKTYQVTGPIIDVTPEAITVKKGNENWTISRGADTKVTGDPRKGDKVTVYYSMTASQIEAKAAAPGAAKMVPAAPGVLKALVAPPRTAPAPMAKPAVPAPAPTMH